MNKHIFCLLILCIGQSASAVADELIRVTVPTDATVFLGTKQRHYMPFDACQLASATINADGTTTYAYLPVEGFSTYNYRVSLPGAMTQVGKFGVNSTHTDFTITREELINHGTADYCNHNTADNSFTNVADILLNGNERGHLTMQPGDTHTPVANRVWQIVDDISNNYFLSPDFSYRVVDEHFHDSSEVLALDSSGTLRAVGSGTAIVMVDYDACFAYGYNNLDGYYGRNADYNFWFGSTWSKLWAENVGILVVTVGVNTFDPQLGWDSELDVLYYPEESDGYHLAIANSEIAKAEVANPIVDSVANTVTYGEFHTADASNVLLTFGRNILRLTDTLGAVAYQVISAKPMGHELTNLTHEGLAPAPGDEVMVQIHGLYHPMPKIAGIYNQSAYLHYTLNGSDEALTLGSGQYNFAGKPKAQQISLTIPTDCSESALTLTDGSIYINGYGSPGGAHRDIDPYTGVNPNTTASITAEYHGKLPDITIPVDQSANSIIEVTDRTASAPELYDLRGIRIPDGITPVSGIYIDRTTRRILRL